jgi:nucleoside-diphosphate-sugar epimerase
MKVAVIGANGFIGSRFVERSQEDGTFEVVPIVRKHSSLARCARFELDARIGDAQDTDSLAAAMSGCDAAFHCVVGDAKQIIGAAKVLPEACVKAGISHVAYLSSASVHGQDVAPGTTEDTPLPARHAISYNASKAAAEVALIRAARSRGVQAAVLRPSIVWGPRSFWIGGFADQLLNGTAGLTESGKGFCNSIYVDNLIDASLLVLRSQVEPGRVYFVQDELSLTWSEFVRPVIEAFGMDADSIPSVPRVSAPPKKRMDISKLKESPFGAFMKRMAGPKVKGFAKAAFNALSKGDTGVKPFELPPVPKSAVNFEISELHCCRGRLSDERIRKELGYSPRITIEEGMRRSVAWLEFAGYPLHGSSGL